MQLPPQVKTEHGAAVAALPRDAINVKLTMPDHKSSSVQLEVTKADDVLVVNVSVQ